MADVGEPMWEDDEATNERRDLVAEALLGAVGEEGLLNFAELEEHLAGFGYVGHAWHLARTRRLELAVDFCDELQACPERWAEHGVPDAELAIDPPSLGLAQ